MRRRVISNLLFLRYRRLDFRRELPSDLYSLSLHWGFLVWSGNYQIGFYLLVDLLTLTADLRGARVARLCSSVKFR